MSDEFHPEIVGDPVSPKERRIASLCHFGALLVMIAPPFNILFTLLIWLMYKKKSMFIDDQGRESLNFQISMMLYVLASALLIYIFVGIFLLGLFCIFGFISVIIAGMRSSQGLYFRYPLNLRIL